MSYKTLNNGNVTMFYAWLSTITYDLNHVRWDEIKLVPVSFPQTESEQSISILRKSIAMPKKEKREITLHSLSEL